MCGNVITRPCTDFHGGLDKSVMAQMRNYLPRKFTENNQITDYIFGLRNDAAKMFMFINKL